MLVKKVFEHHKNITIKSFDGLLVDFLHQEHIKIIVRGIRNTSDYIQESQLAGMNATLDPLVETLFLSATKDHACISSSIVRDILRTGKDASSFIPSIINDYFKHRAHE
jgi:pantetheine-phosphate adenylyltransferase